MAFVLRLRNPTGLRLFLPQPRRAHRRRRRAAARLRGPDVRARLAIRSFLHDQWRLLLTASGYFTRIPMPAWVGHSDTQLRRAARYFPLVGVFVGAGAAGLLCLAALLWPLTIAVALSIAFSVWITGAFHEDGLADSADGLGGGYTRQRVLEIMQDSRIGSFGALALVLALLLKFASLVTLADVALVQAAAALVCAHAVSRAAALVVMAHLPYARMEGPAKAKPVAEGIGRAEWLPGVLTAALALGVASACGVLAWPALLAVLATSGAGVLLALRTLRIRLQGYTGDTLGATQQIVELGVYLAWIAAMRACGWT